MKNTSNIQLVRKLANGSFGYATRRGVVELEHTSTGYCRVIFFGDKPSVTGTGDYFISFCQAIKFIRKYAAGLI